MISVSRSASAVSDLCASAAETDHFVDSHAVCCLVVVGLRDGALREHLLGARAVVLGLRLLRLRGLGLRGRLLRLCAHGARVELGEDGALVDDRAALDAYVATTLPAAPAATFASCEPMSDPDSTSVRGTFSACASVGLTGIGGAASGF